MQRLCQVIHHIVGDDRRAGDQQSLALLSPARWCWFLPGGTFLRLPDNAFSWQGHHLYSPYVCNFCPRPYILCSASSIRTSVRKHISPLMFVTVSSSTCTSCFIATS